MQKFALIQSKTIENFPLLSEENRPYAVDWLRGGLHFSSLLGLVVSFILQSEFLSWPLESWIFLGFAVASLIHVLALHQLQAHGRRALFDISFFADAALIAWVSVGYQSTHSLFLFIFLLNIFLGALANGFQFSMRLGLASVFFVNVSLLVQTAVTGQTNLTVFAIYNGGLLVIAALSGLFSDEIKTIGLHLHQQSRDLAALANLNDLIIDNMGSGLFVIDSQGQIVRSNRSSVKVFQGLGLNGRSLDEVIPGLMPKLYNCAKTERFELNVNDLLGHNMVLEIIASPLRIETEQIGGWTVLLQNLTQVKSMEATLRQKEKLAAVGQLAAGIAHEIRNPLASISGSVQLLAGTLPTQTLEDKKLLSIIIKEIDRLNTLISEFLEYVRPEVRAQDRVNISNLASDILDMAKVNDRLTKGVSIHKDLRSQRDITGHYDKLKQALLNIVINAYQAMEKSTLKSLTAKTFDEEGFVVLEISDTGCGITSDHVPRIFEPFHTTKPHGTGLGLAITHKILETHGVEIGVDSSVGKGTVFRLKFPVNTV